MLRTIVIRTCNAADPAPFKQQMKDSLQVCDNCDDSGKKTSADICRLQAQDCRSLWLASHHIPLPSWSSVRAPSPFPCISVCFRILFCELRIVTDVMPPRQVTLGKFSWWEVHQAGAGVVGVLLYPIRAVIHSNVLESLLAHPQLDCALALILARTSECIKALCFHQQQQHTSPLAPNRKNFLSQTLSTSDQTTVRFMSRDAKR